MAAGPALTYMRCALRVSWLLHSTTHPLYTEFTNVFDGPLPGQTNAAAPGADRQHDPPLWECRGLADRGLQGEQDVGGGVNISSRDL